MLKRLFLAAAFFASTMGFGFPAHAAPPPNISSTVGICSPWNPATNCIKPNSDGSINVVGGGGGGGGTSSNFGAAVPTAGTAAGFSDGTNMQSGRVFDTDTGAGTEYTQGAVIRLPGSGGSTAGGTSTNPIRVDPTGTTAQPATQSGTWTVQPGNTANTTPWLITGSGTAGSAATGVQTVQGIASMTPLFVGGSVASGASAAGNPVPAGGDYNSTKPTLTNGQRGTLQLGTAGSLSVQLYGADSTTAFAVGNSNGDTLATNSTTSLLQVNSVGRLYNGSNYSRSYEITAATTAGTGTAAIHMAPTSAAAGGIALMKNSAAASSLVLKASAGNLYTFRCTNTSASAIWVLLFNATSAPADGAVTPEAWWQVAANADLSVSYGDVPVVLGTGGTLSISSTGPFTKTAVTSGACSGQMK